MPGSLRRLLCLAVLLLFVAAPAPQPQRAIAPAPTITTPQEQFGFSIGDDYHLTNYTQLTDYWRKLDQQSDRMTLTEIGKTAEGRPHWMAIITSPANHARLERYREISRRLALAEDLTDEQARALAAEGRTVVWVDGGLHATEVLGSHQLMQLVYEMVAGSDPETLRFLDDVILLAVHANPDGHELVGNWYMREPEPARRSTSNIPRLYQKYIGHDNNRDFYLSAQPETANMNRILYQEWLPQIVYNHHQSGPVGTVVFVPPFRDPFNYVYDPLVPLGIDLVGAAMHTRLAREGKPGATMRRGASYSTWWNGGLRTTVYFHNMIGLLTEMIGNPTPMEIPFVPERQLPSGDYPYPIAPQPWHFRQSIDYSLTLNRAVLDIASRNRENFLYNIYRMGRNSIERGSRDTWTRYPRRIESVQAAIRQETGAARPDSERLGVGAVAPARYFDLLRTPESRDPRGYVLPADQPDFLTATKFVNALMKTGVVVHRATAPFEASGTRYVAGSYVIKTAQAFRPHVLDMFEPQDHPDDFRYPGGPPVPPYDSAGYTLAFQMGVRFDRVLEGFDGPFERVDGSLTPPPAPVPPTTAAGYLLGHEMNDAFVAVNRLLREGRDVYWLTQPITAAGRTHPAGTMYVPRHPSLSPTLRRLASDVGLSFHALDARPAADALKLRPVRIGLWDRYGGSMPSGWLRWLFEEFEFPFEVVYPQELDAGRLRSRFDVLVFVDGAIPARDDATTSGPPPDSVPAEFRPRLGAVTVARTIPEIRRFLEEGGTVAAIGSSTNLAALLGLPVVSALTEPGTDGIDRPLPRDKFYVPGSILEVAVDGTHPLSWGIGPKVDVMFDESPVFRLPSDANQHGLRRVAWFDSGSPLRSGWAWGQRYLEGGAAIVEASVAQGRLFLFGPEITFRAQPHGTFKFLFNAIYYGTALPARIEGGTEGSAQEAAGAAIRR